MNNEKKLTEEDIKLIATIFSIIFVISFIILIFFIIFKDSKKNKNNYVKTMNLDFFILDIFDKFQILYDNRQYFFDKDINIIGNEIKISTDYNSILDEKINNLFEEFEITGNLNYKNSDMLIIDNPTEILNLNYEMENIKLDIYKYYEYSLNYEILKYFDYRLLSYLIDVPVYEKIEHIFKYVFDDKEEIYRNYYDLYIKILEHIKTITINENIIITDKKSIKIIKDVNKDYKRNINHITITILNYLNNRVSNYIELIELILKITLYLLGCCLYNNTYTQGFDSIFTNFLIFSKINPLTLIYFNDYIKTNTYIFNMLNNLSLNNIAIIYRFLAFNPVNNIDYNTYIDTFNMITKDNFDIEMLQISISLPIRLIQFLYKKQYICFSYYSIMCCYYFQTKLKKYIESNIEDTELKYILYIILNLKCYIECINKYGNIPAKFNYDKYLKQKYESSPILTHIENIQHLLIHNLYYINNSINPIIKEYNNLPFIINWEILENDYINSLLNDIKNIKTNSDNIINILMLYKNKFLSEYNVNTNI